jgi:2-dehydropantoate 2-reductase
MNALIMGAGALGSVFGGFLSSIQEVSLVGKGAHIQEVKKEGLKITGIWGEHRFEDLTAYTAEEIPDIEEQDLIMITTKSYDTEAAVNQALPLLKRDTLVMSMQNGIGNEEVIARTVGRDRTMGGMAIFGAALLAPGHVKVTVYASECLVGMLDGSYEKAKGIAEIFTNAGIPTLPTQNIIREKWMKAFYNIALNPLSAVLRVPYGFLGEHEETRALMKHMLQEAFRIAGAEGIKLDKTPEEYFQYLLEKQLPPTAQHRSSMLQDIERGKKTEIDYLNGAVARLGRKHRILTPYNDAMAAIITSLERARQP